MSTNEGADSSQVDSSTSTISQNTSTDLDVSTSTVSPCTTPHLKGSRVISLEKLRDVILTITCHSTACQSVVELIGEVKRDGLGCILLAKCSKCSEEFKIRSCDKIDLTREDGTKRTTYQTNVAAVMGQISTGCGCRSLEESMSIMGVPSLSKPMFIDIERCLGLAFEDYLTELMLKAGQEEKQIAIQNETQHHELPAISVIVDGGWSKRSHGHSYNANSGVGVIFGAATKKLLYIGVRNKYCAVCSIAKKKQLTPPQHKCLKNWCGSSTSMEADIIAAGFKASESMHGLHYTEVIGNGDSSVLHTVQTTVPYGRDVKKVECANHAVKCYRGRLEQLAKDYPTFRGRGAKQLSQK